MLRNDRIARLREWMLQHDMSGVVVFSYKSALTGYWSGYFPRSTITNAAVLVVSSDKSVLFTRLPIHGATVETGSEFLEHICVAGGMSLVGTQSEMAGAAAAWIRTAIPVGRIAGVAAPFEGGVLAELAGLLPGRLEDQSSALARLATEYTEADLRELALAMEAAGKAFTAGCAAVRAGSTLEDVRRSAEEVLVGESALGWHCFVATSGNGGALSETSTTQMRSGDMLMLEIVPRIREFCPEVVGNVFVDYVPTELKKVHEAILATLSTLMQELSAQASPSTALRVVHELLGRDHGVDSSEMLRLGHGSGLDNIEVPDTFRPDDRECFGDGRVISIHPTIKVPGWGVVLRGGTGIVREHGFTPLFSLPDHPLVSEG